MKHKVLVVGGGGRCHAIVDALSRSPKVGKIYCAPGNAGIAAQAECVPLKETQTEALRDFAKENDIDLTVVGPEVALAAGIADVFRAAGLRIFGPDKAAATIESSKDFAKRLMDKYNVPTAAFRTFEDYAEAVEYVRNGKFPVVLKYDGLAAGKGVVIPETFAEVLVIGLRSLRTSSRQKAPPSVSGESSDTRGMRMPTDPSSAATLGARYWAPG